MYYKILIVLFFLLIAGYVTSQVNDAGYRQNICLERRITQQWDFHFNYQARINQNITNFYLTYGDFGLRYKLNKHIHLRADYVFAIRKDKDKIWNIRHQAYVALTLKQKIGHFTFSDRIRYQVQYQRVYSSEFGTIPDYRLRNKGTAKYNNNSRYTYYVACEVYYKLNDYYKAKMPEGHQFDRVRYFAGLFYQLNKVNEIELYYLVEKHFNVNNPTTNFVIGVGYSHIFY